jgi:ATP-dependent Zn protease
VAVGSVPRTFFAWVSILSFAIWISGCAERNYTDKNQPEILYSELYAKVTSGDVRDVVIEDNMLYGHLKSSPQMEFKTRLPADYEELTKAMLAARVNITIKAVPIHSLSPLLVNLIPLAVLSLAWLLTIPPFWVIFKKAGFQPILSIVMLVPLVNLIMLYIVAFSKWKGDPPQVI